MACFSCMLIRPCHTAAILSRETKKALFYHAKPRSGDHNRGQIGERGFEHNTGTPGILEESRERRDKSESL